MSACFSGGIAVLAALARWRSVPGPPCQPPSPDHDDDGDTASSLEGRRRSGATRLPRNPRGPAWRSALGKGIRRFSVWTCGPHGSPRFRTFPVGAAATNSDLGPNDVPRDDPGCPACALAQRRRGWGEPRDRDREPPARHRSSAGGVGPPWRSPIARRPPSTNPAC